MAKTFKWGLMAPGNIAGKFAACVKAMDNTEIEAVGSRSTERARTFAEKWSIRKSYGSYRDVAEDPEVRAVYIASPHRYHKDQIRMTLNAGKGVLCEKPITVNAAELKELTSLAKEKGVFLMEAMWMRHLPALQKLKKEWLPKGKLGTIKRITADFSFVAPSDPQGRLYNPELAGGALLDAGIYPLSFAYWLVGRKPDEMISLHEKGSTGVDTHEEILMKWHTGETAVLTVAIDTKGPRTASVLGTAGAVELPNPFFGAQSILFLNEKGKESLSLPFDINGFEYEIREAMRCIGKGLLESPEHTWSETMDMMEIMDELRTQWGLRYSFES
jgi:dihydrodiol dehydrogenase / D-xylose 1-dehydrogenase (NADP)